MTDKMLPHKLEDERRVLGCLLVEHHAISQVADTLRAEHFYRDAHQIIYSAMISLYERQEENDYYSIEDYLERTDKLEQIGGSRYLSDLADATAVSARLETYVGRIIDTYKLRKIIHAGGQMVAMAYESGETSADMVVEQAEALVYGISSHDTVKEVVSAETCVNEFFQWFKMDEPANGAIVGVPSGLYDLDKKTGGWQKSDLVVIAGRPAMGKTSLMMSIARNAAVDHGCGVLAFSLEMSRGQLMQRLIALEARVDVQRVRFQQVEEDEKVRIIEAGGVLCQAPIYIDDTPGITLSAMRSRIRRTLAQHNIDLIIIDYLQLIQATMDGKRIRERYQEVSEVARGLKNLAREFDLPVLALAQLSRAVEGRADKVPQLSDLRDSGEIEQAADIVVFIHRDDYYAGFDKETGMSKSDRPKTADLVFAKHRNGAIGEVVVGFEASQTRFHDLAERFADGTIVQEG